MKKIFGFMLLFVILPAFSYADIPQSDIPNQEDGTCTCPEYIAGVKNMASKSKCVLYGDKCEVEECEEGACLGFYGDNAICVPLTEAGKDSHGFCVTGLCDCTEDSNAETCAWHSGACEPVLCAMYYQNDNGRCVKDREVKISNDVMHDKKTNPGEYTIDPREYVKWGEGECPKPYDKMVLMLKNGFGSCTAEYIATNMILTAQHCVVDDNNNIEINEKFTFLDCKGNRFLASVKSYGDNNIYKGLFNHWGDHSVPVDWVLLSVDSQKFYSKAIFDLKDVVGQHDINVNNAGWGAMPILSDQQIKDLRNSFNDYASEVGSFASFSNFQKLFLHAYDDKLKVHKNCMLHTYNRSVNQSGFHSSTCYTWGGNSGGPYYDGNKILGIVSGNVRDLPDNEVSDVIVPTVQYISQEQKNCEKANEAHWENNVCLCNDKDKEWQVDKCNCKTDNYIIGSDGKCVAVTQPISPEQRNCELDLAKKSGAIWNGSLCECSVFGTSWDGEKNRCVCGNPDETVQDGVCKTSPRKLELDDAKKEIMDRCFNQQKLKTMSDYEFLVCLGQMSRIQQLQQAYDEAKAKEQSMANRMLTAATIAATGIGGMELAQGLAEQKADKEAEQDMSAYISTMRCKYGDKQIKAGNEEIELPGGNDATMMKLKAEYIALAADLKERKEALGMKPGIESEIILDKSQMGLYAQENLGITDGAYSSLYRAKMLNSEEDQQEIDEAKQTSKNRVVGGGAAVGVGVVGGVAGDYLINEKSRK